MRDKKSYRFTKPPTALVKARLDNIAIVPASMLPFQKTVQDLIHALPQGAVFLCHAEKNTRQRQLLARVEEAFREQGYTVMNLSAAPTKFEAKCVTSGTHR